ncbi:hypothetical protein RYX36_036894, partial [Vicia faba]
MCECDTSPFVGLSNWQGRKWSEQIIYRYQNMMNGEVTHRIERRLSEGRIDGDGSFHRSESEGTKVTDGVMFRLSVLEIVSSSGVLLLFYARRMLEMLRNKRLVFVGDSIGRLLIDGGALMRWFLMSDIGGITRRPSKWNEVNMNMSTEDAFRISVETVVDWIAREVNRSKTYVLFRT